MACAGLMKVFLSRGGEDGEGDDAPPRTYLLEKEGVLAEGERGKNDRSRSFRPEALFLPHDRTQLRVNGLVLPPSRETYMALFP
jgi:hypothetical protein